MSADKPQLLADLLDRHGPALRLFAGQWCRSPDDVVQEALIELAGQSEWPKNALAWLFHVVRNRAISQARSASARQRHEAQAAELAGQWFARRAAQDHETELAAEVLASLPAKLREVLVAHFWGGLTFAEIGELTGTSASTAHRRYEAALQRLKQEFGDQQDLDEPCSTNRTTND